jgi:hypothetical protein
MNQPREPVGHECAPEWITSIAPLKDGTVTHEIAVCPSYTHDAKRLAANVAHEMVHLAQPADPSKVKYTCPTCGFNAWHKLRRKKERTLGCPHDGAYVPMVRAITDERSTGDAAAQPPCGQPLEAEPQSARHERCDGRTKRDTNRSRRDSRATTRRARAAPKK